MPARTEPSALSGPFGDGPQPVPPPVDVLLGQAERLIGERIRRPRILGDCVGFAASPARALSR